MQLVSTLYLFPPNTIISSVPLVQSGDDSVVPFLIVYSATPMAIVLEYEYISPTGEDIESPQFPFP